MQLWYEKYRPKTLKDYVWPDHMREKVERWVGTPESFPHLVLNGPTGTGKTTLARVLKHELNIEDEDFLFVQSAMLSGVDTMRGLIMEFCQNSGFSGMKLVVLDEADRLSKDAQKILLNVIDSYQSHVRFILTCNDPKRLMTPLVEGRCRLFQVQALDEDEFTDRLIHICGEENIRLETEDDIGVIIRIVDRYHPNLRKAIDVLQDWTTDGVLTEPHSITDSRAEWESSLLSSLRGNPISSFRESIAGMDANETQSVYKFLYESSETLFGENEDKAIVLIASYLDRNSRSSFPDITLCACIVELNELP